MCVCAFSLFFLTVSRTGSGKGHNGLLFWILNFFFFWGGCAAGCRSGERRRLPAGADLRGAARQPAAAALEPQLHHALRRARTPHAGRGRLLLHQFGNNNPRPLSLAEKKKWNHKTVEH